jgi:hypothetical protein
MTVTHIGTISILNTSLPDTYCIPRSLSISNLFGLIVFITKNG